MAFACSINGYVGCMTGNIVFIVDLVNNAQLLNPAQNGGPSVSFLPWHVKCISVLVDYLLLRWLCVMMAGSEF